QAAEQADRCERISSNTLTFGVLCSGADAADVGGSIADDVLDLPIFEASAPKQLRQPDHCLVAGARDMAPHLRPSTGIWATLADDGNGVPGPGLNGLRPVVPPGRRRNLCLRRRVIVRVAKPCTGCFPRSMGRSSRSMPLRLSSAPSSTADWP